MQFFHTNLGYRQRGEIVEVTLTSGANVRLMDSSNFSSYKSGRSHRYVGGLARRSPVRLAIPHSGHWHVAVDMQGLRGSTRAGVRVLPGPLPEIREAPLSSVPSLVRDAPPGVAKGEEAYDVFISHASEDKDAIVRSLAGALTANGLKVWYDEFSLRIGDSLRQKIDRGLASSRVGLVVLSPSFIAKGWTNYELDGIVTRTVSGEQILLPIWHNITNRHFPFDLARLRRRAVFRHCTALPPLRLPRFRGIFGLPGRRRTLALGSKVAFRARFSCWAHGIPLEYHDADHFEGIVESW